MSHKKSSNDFKKNEFTRLCICGRAPKSKSSIKSGDYYIIISIVSFFLIGGIFVEPKVSLTIIGLALALVAVLTLLRKLVNHTWKCSLRWAILSPLGILQYI